MKTLVRAITMAGAVVGLAQAAQAVSLGSFVFDDTKFGNSVSASDGGTAQASNWLNVVRANPGLTGSLTGANFDTGIANIGAAATYTISYSDGIFNRDGADLGVVSARFSADPFDIAFSSDGVTFGAFTTVTSASAVATGVDRAFFYQNSGPFSASLFVTPLNLSDFGIAAGTSISAVRIASSNELDLVRVAGFESAVPEPATWAMFIGGFGLVGGALRRRRSTGVRFA